MNNIISITFSAQKYIASLLSNKVNGTNIRLLVVNPGFYNAECRVLYCPKDTIHDNDVEIKFKLFSVYIDKTDIPFLQNSEIDFIVDELESQLTFTAPNITSYEFDKNSSLIERVQHIIESFINPQLAVHGGYISVIEITNDMIVVLEFSGGCNGCTMAHYTLKEKIEKELLHMIPELKGVKDFTEHKHGKHSFY